MEQRTEEWFQARLGKLTSSRVHDALAKRKDGKWASSRERYQAELICERMTGQPYPSFVSADMRWGMEQEELAKIAYEFATGEEVTAVGFVEHPAIFGCGCSPDGLIGDAGLYEGKAPASHTHIGYLLGAPIPDDYVMQMEWQLACTGRQWCDWVSFDPRLPEHLRLHIRRIWMIDERRKELEREAVVFLNEVDERMRNLEKMYATVSPEG